MKFLYGYFNQNTGESNVALADRYGTYVGQAKLHPDDKINASEYMGCGLAQKRAWIKALKNRRRRTKIKLNTIKNLIKDIDQNCSNLTNLPAFKKRLNLKLKYYNKEIEDINNDIDEINKNIKKRIEIRNKILQKGQK